MKRSVVLIFTILLMPFLSHAEGGSVVSGGFKSPKAILVSLISPGDGIDKVAEAKLLALINKNLRNRYLSVLTTKIIGFEGDVQYCLEFQSSNILDVVSQEIYAIQTAARHMQSTLTETCVVDIQR